ncbi:MAG: hypothetical protein ACRD2J_07045, partial [Thermoanaerobaculia bacterium]
MHIRHAVFVVAALLLTTPAAARSLYWNEVGVEAHLDAEGRLRVRETQRMVFDGDWNGGERIFRLEPGQELELHGIARIDDETGALVPLRSGDLSDVDEFAFTDSKTLRWRSRLPSDPPFDAREIAYVLDYSLENILQTRGDAYLLDHAFLFPDRDGIVKRFTLDLRFDDAWRAEENPVHREQTNVPPGESAVVTVPLEYTGAGAPEARRDPRIAMAILLFFLAAIPFLMWRRFLGRERALGRLEPLPGVDRGWIERHLLPLRAEVAGAVWDRDVQAPEVSALLARLVAEKKLESEITGSDGDPEMRLTLKVPRESLGGYERKLIDGLFFSGDTTSTSAIKEHYKSKGFDPAGRIRHDVKDEARQFEGPRPNRAGASCLIPVGLFLVALVPWAFSVAGAGPLPFVLAVGTFFLGVMAGIIGHTWHQRIDYGTKQARYILIPVAIGGLVAAAAILIFPAFVALKIAAVLATAFVTSVGLAAARSTQEPEALAFRKKLAAARAWFSRELERPDPNLEDAWFPYILAFGLNEKASKWFEAFGGAARGIGASPTTFGSSSSSAARGWSGGGGAFGGAGASGAWTV